MRNLESEPELELVVIEPKIDRLKELKEVSNLTRRIDDLLKIINNVFRKN